MKDITSPTVKPKGTNAPKTSPAPTVKARSGAQPERLADHGLEGVLWRWRWTRANARQLASGLRWNGMALVLSISLNIVQYSTRPETKYIHLDASGRPIDVPALSEPVVTDAQVLRFAAEAASECFTYGFTTWSRDMEHCRPYWTVDGFSSYTRGLQDARAKEALMKSFADQSTVPQGAGVIVQAKLQGGRVYAWDIQLPMLTTTSVGALNVPRQFVLALTIVRVSPLIALPPIKVEAMNDTSASR